MAYAMVEALTGVTRATDSNSASCVRCDAGQSNFGQCGRVHLVVSKVNSAACLMNIEA